MAAAARLERLRKHVQLDLDMLPCKAPSPDPVPALLQEPLSDDETSGGVSLQATQSKQPTEISSPASTADSATKPASNPPVVPKENAQEENNERRFVWVQGAASSYNLGSMPKVSALPTVKLPLNSLKKGELAPIKYFTPIVALSRYPYKLCNQTCMQEIASAFFDAGKFWAREWDLYYVWDIEESKPLILVSEKQFEDLLKEINSELKLGLRVTDQQREDGLVSRFPDHPRCLPRYLGRSRSRDDYDTMIDNVPSAISRLPGEPMPPSLDGRTLEDFKQMMEELSDLQKAKGKAAREKKKLDRIAKQKSFADQFKRAQRYLGLRSTAQNAQTASGLPPAVNISLPAPFPCDRSVVFVCVDVESYEKAHNKIIEIGVATLDTRDLAGIPPGRDGENWRSKIRARHFRVQDHAHLVNCEFVSGCPDRFDFGKSEWVRLNDAPTIVASCFKAPFAVRPDQVSDGMVTMLQSMNLNERRNLIFLGHDTLGDIKYLQQLGFDPLTLPNLLEAQDTATMYRVWRREQQPTKLGNILYNFDIAGFNLHNAGNDAVYTVQAMLGICVREASIRGTSRMKVMRNEEKAAKVAAAQEEAKKLAEDEAAGWSDNEADGDGGAPVPIVIKETPKPSPTPNQVRQCATVNAPNPTSGGGRGRRRGGWSGRGCSDDAIRANGYQTQDTLSSRSDPGRYRHPGRPQADGRGQGRGRGGGRGRARGSLNDRTPSRTDEGFAAAQFEPPVKYYW